MRHSRNVHYNFFTLRRAGLAVKLISACASWEKNMVFKMVDTFLTQKKFKNFFKKNVTTL